MNQINMDFAGRNSTYFSELRNRLWEMRDKRVDDWPLMNSPIILGALIVNYLCFCCVLGPSLMRNRKPFELRKIIVVFNFVMVVFNAYIHYQCWALGWGTDYNWQCQSIDRSMSPRAIQTAQLVWLYLILKIIDWTDTVFFVLAKKSSHISVLHICHHVFMPQCAWIGVRYMPGGHPTFIGLINTAVHVIMHTYYGIAALGPKYRKYLWWKRYLTILQLAQFVVIILHGIQPLVLDIDCDFSIPREMFYFCVAHGFIFIYLFANFYRHSYIETKNNAVDKKIE